MTAPQNISPRRRAPITQAALSAAIGTSTDSLYIPRFPNSINDGYIQPLVPNTDCIQCRIPNLTQATIDGLWVDADSGLGMGRLCAWQYHETPGGLGADLYNCYYGGTDRTEYTSRYDHHHKFTGTVWIAQRTLISGDASDTGGVVSESRLGIKAAGRGETGGVIRSVEAATGVSGKQVMWIDPIITDPGVNSTLIVTAVTTDSASNPNVTYTKFTRQWQSAGAYKTADESVNNTTLQDDDHLTTNLVAGATYKFRFEIYFDTAAANEGLKLALGGTATATEMKAQISIYDDVTTNALLAFGRVTALASPIGVTAVPVGSNYAIVEGTIKAATLGTFRLSWAQNAHVSASTTISKGSSLTITRLA